MILLHQNCCGVVWPFVQLTPLPELDSLTLRGKSSARSLRGRVAANQQKFISRRAFARRAVLFSASAAFIPEGALPASNSHAAQSAQLPDNAPKLSPAGQAEAEVRYQLVLSRYGPRLSDEDKRNIKTLIFFSQPGLERLRSFSLKNGDVPALFLKPIVEREKTPPATRPSGPPVAPPKHS